MNVPDELGSRIVSLLRQTLVSISVSLVAIWIYVKYISPTAMNSIVYDLLPLVLCYLLAVLVIVNLIYFSAKMRQSHPSLARGVSFTFTAVTFCYLFFLPMLHVYSFDMGRVVSYLFVSLAASFALNVVAHFAFRKRPTLP